MNVPAERGTTFWVMRDVDVNQLNKALKPDKATKVKEGEKTPTLTGACECFDERLGRDPDAEWEWPVERGRRQLRALSDPDPVGLSRGREQGANPGFDHHAYFTYDSHQHAEHGCGIRGYENEVPVLRTNGEVIAVAGRGYYDWKEPWLDVRLHAESLPGLWKRLPLVDDPFKIVLARRATGTFSDPKWEEISGLRDFFRDTEKDMN